LPDVNLFSLNCLLLFFLSAFVCLPRPDPDPVRGELLKDDPEDAGVVRPSSAGEKFCLRQFELFNAKIVQLTCCRFELFSRKMVLFKRQKPDY
jgi:hypothetical protein